MKHISILVPNGDVVSGSITGTLKVFKQVNEIAMRMGKNALFEIYLVGETKVPQLYEGLFAVTAQKTLIDIEKTDLIIIPAIHGDLKRGVEINQELLPWIRKHHFAGAEVASLCVGAFLLASTGLLDGKKCATHWIAETEFKQMFPQVDLVADKIITDEKGIYTSGGAYSFLNLIMYLVEKYAGRELAVMCSKIFAVDLGRGSQSPFIIFNGQKEHEDKIIRDIQLYIENNFQEKITVDKLAEKFALSRRNLERRFKKATYNTISEYIQRVKIEAAKLSLESSHDNVNEVMYNVGYNDTKAFRGTFKKITGLSPLQYRTKYSRSNKSLGQ